MKIEKIPLGMGMKRYSMTLERAVQSSYEAGKQAAKDQGVIERRGSEVNERRQLFLGV